VKRLRLPDGGFKETLRFRPQLRVLEYISTKKGDAERGPMVWLSPTDAKIRLLSEGILAWIEGPRRSELAVVAIDDNMPDGSVRLRDIAGVAVTEHVIVSRPDIDPSKPARTVA
jgi:anaerobic selenocysteine-containing dehydrogenase